jgi:hypothetical protein
MSKDLQVPSYQTAKAKDTAFGCVFTFAVLGRIF